MKRNYETDEITRHFNAIKAIEAAPLPERQAAREEWHQALLNPALVAERIGWLLDGNYGYGAYHLALITTANRRLNRAAWLAHTIAALEWRCSSVFARQVLSLIHI